MLNLALVTLALDTTGSNCAMAISDAFGHVWQRQENGSMRQTQRITPMFSTLLSESKLSVSDLKLLVYANGPANFTGLRLAASWLQGLAFGLALPLIGVSSLQAAAQQLQAANKRVAVLMDAKMNQVYYGLYQLEHGKPAKALRPDSLLNLDQVNSQLASDQPDAATGDLPASQTLAKYNYQMALPLNASILLTLGLTYWKQHPDSEFWTAERAMPIYLRGQEAWQKNPQP